MKHMNCESFAIISLDFKGYIYLIFARTIFNFIKKTIEFLYN